MTTDTEDRSTWPRNGLVIRRDELLRLIEEKGAPLDLDLRGARFLGDGQEDVPLSNPIDLSPEALADPATAYKKKRGGSEPPWLDSNGGIHLVGAWLQGAHLGFAKLQGAHLGYARLQGAVLRHAQLQGAVLSYAELQGADLSEAQLQGADLYGAQLQGADLSLAQLKEADLFEAQLQGACLIGTELQEAVLGGAQLQGADLYGAQLRGAKLWSAQLQRVDMYGVESLDGAHWGPAFLEYTRINRRHLGRSIGDEDEAYRLKSAGPEDKESKAGAYRRASEAYLLLKNNFNQIGRYEDASWAYVKEQQMEKMAHYWRWRAWGQSEEAEEAEEAEEGPSVWEWRSWGWKVWRAWGPLWRWLRNWAYELATGYGERVYMPVVWAIVVVVVFAAIYATAGNIASGDVGSLQGEPTHNPLIALVHSISAFATIGFNTLEPQGWGARLLTALEAMFGVGLFALFIFTLGNRMSRS
jgi:uncharacterized protein YjbI with pentapeptide repeats